MKICFLAFCCSVILLFSSATRAQLSDFGLHLAWGEGSSRYMFKGDEELTPDTFRLSLQFPTTASWRWSDAGELRLQFDLAVHHWKDPLLNDPKNGAGILPMWRYYHDFANASWFLGLGVGVTYIDGRLWMDRQMGSRWMFEDKFEAGVVIANRHQISYSLIHYSNANLADINHGGNINYLSYGYRW